MEKKKKKVGSLPVIEPNAAGVDIGATHMVVNRCEYDTTAFQDQERRSQDRKRSKLHLQAKELGFNLVPMKAVP